MAILRTLKDSILKLEVVKKYLNSNYLKPIDLNYGFKEIKNLDFISSDFDKLINWLRIKAGSSNNKYFKTKFKGGLKLQQIPEEYAALLIYLKNLAPNKYLEIGVGNGGSWLVTSYFLRTKLSLTHAVDNLSYGNAISQNLADIQEIQKFLSRFIDNVKFFHTNSVKYFTDCKETYDIIFIDGDHSYEGVKSDYYNAKEHLNKGGVIIFHDINSAASPGVGVLWNEIKSDCKIYKEFIFGQTCGIGVIHI